MIKKVASKLIPKKIYLRLKNLVKPVKIDYYSVAELTEKLTHFDLKKIAILTDGKTDLSVLFQSENFKDIELIGIYSFNLEIIDNKVSEYEILPLLAGAKVPTDGWIVSTLNESDSFSLSRHLFENGMENQVTLEHVKNPNGTKYYSYADFFSNEQKTVIHINNYFRRCYALAFPINLKLTLRDINGNKHTARQIILPPDTIRIIRSEDFNVSNFAGYLEVEFEMAKKVTPFLHYMVDYLAPNFISSNHQSGLGLHPAGSEFTRGYVPVEKDKSLEICLFQKNYDQPVICHAILNYMKQNGENISYTKDFPPLAKKNMLYVDVKKLFNEIDFTKTLSPVVTVKSDVPLHRPNYYYTSKNGQGYYDTSHAGPDLKKQVAGTFRGFSTITDKEKTILNKFSVYGGNLRHHVLPKELEIESIISIGGNDSTYPIKEFKIDLYNQNGDLIRSFEETLDFDRNRYMNINDYLSKKGLPDFHGTVSFRPGQKAKDIPINLNSITGYIHHKSKYVTSTAGNGSNPDNIPFYFRGGPPNFLKLRSSAGTTDVFARGVASDEFDTIFTVSYQTADKNLKKKIKYEIQLNNTLGEKKIIYRTLSPNAYDVLKLSDMVSETNHSSSGGYYTVWLFSPEAHLYGQHILIRKRDNAIAVEHCYAGKFGL
ncbi:MAG: hypothetical protein WC666_00780 [Candidatus Paceibacterota bacterium]